MLAVFPRREDGARGEACGPEDDAPVRFGEGPTRVTAPARAWTDTLEVLARTGAALDEATVEETLDAMQEDALAGLDALLDEAGIDRGERLVIGLDGRGGLDVDDHPQRERVLELLARHPALADTLRRMAALALTGRGARDIARAEGLMNGDGAEGGRVFQACLKGGLSHFHLVRK